MNHEIKSKLDKATYMSSKSLMLKDPTVLRVTRSVNTWNWIQNRFLEKVYQLPKTSVFRCKSWKLKIQTSNIPEEYFTNYTTKVIAEM